MLVLQVTTLLSFLSLLGICQGHGHLKSPRSRNWVASPQQEGTWTRIPGMPAAESCPHCLNRKIADRLCGIGNAGDYDDWLDSTGVPMAWQSQAILRVGEEFDVTAFLDTNHAGHMELRVCKYDDPNMPLNQACLDAHPLEFVQDLSYGIPKDVNHPERAYFADVGSQSTFNFKFKVPDSYTDIIGDKVLMQWRYITANSCQPQGYKNSDISDFLLSKGWLRSGGGLSDCVEPYEPDGSRTSTSPEQFWNCAEVTVVAGGPVAPSAPSPPVAQPVSSPVSTPVSQPVAQPVSPPVAEPTGGTSGYCNYGPDGTGATSTCNGQAQGGDWCNQMESQCLNCNGRWCTNGSAPSPPVAQPVASPVSTPVAQPVAQPVSSPVSTPVAQPVSPPVAEPTGGTSGYCNYGPDGTGATSTCNGQAQGGDWCNQMESQCLNCNGRWCTNGTPNPPPAPTPTVPSPSPPTGLPAGFATTTRYWDCSGGACGCAYLANGQPGKETHCHSNAMFAAPTNNPYGAKYYGTAAVSPALFSPNNSNVSWLGEGCGRCWKVTGTANIPGLDTSTTTTIVLKGVNLCPADANSYWCGNGKVHFDIAAPGFDVLQYSASNTCQDREPAEINGFTACEGWPGQSCDCNKFNDPVLRAGCENFISLMWDNAQVAYEEVACPFELDRLNCWEENGGAYPFGIPEFCASNVESNPSTPSVTVTASPTARPSLRRTSSPTKAPVSSPKTKSPTQSPTKPPVSPENTYCCSWNNFNCGTDAWCNSSQGNCVNSCGGSWISTSPPSDCRLSKWSECTNDPTGCCGSTCNGKPGDHYRQCL